MPSRAMFHRGYSDLLGDVSTARVPPANAPTWTTWNFGIGGGIAFAVLEFEINDYFDIYYQTHHGVALSTVVENHIHWTIPTNSAGTRVKFQVDVIAAAIGSAFAVPAGSPFSKEYTLGGTESGVHNYLDIGTIPAFNTTVSSIAIVRLKRVAAAASDYAGNVYILFNDCHSINDSIGSITETGKT